jgi:superoxide reductase
MKQIKIYKCSMCNNIVLKLKDDNENLACCGKPMILMDANTSDGASEKHVPFVKGKIDKVPNKFEVQIGSVIHPMTPEHHIE